jgi:hypothetical protein
MLTKEQITPMKKVLVTGKELAMKLSKSKLFLINNLNL